VGFFQKISEGLKKTKENMMQKVNQIFSSFRPVDEELFEELEETLIMSDVGMITAEEVCDRLRKGVKERGITDSGEVKALLQEILTEMMEGDTSLNISTKPSVILVIGVNGVGKTTTIGKLAANLTAEGKKVILGAADTFRAAAIDQLQIWADRAGVEMVRQSEGSDPAAVVFDTIAAGKARGADVVICDTAGRLHNKKNLMDELAKINRVISRELPDAARETLLILDATTGQNAVIQASEFKNAADITGLVLTKLDGTAKGGIVFSIKRELDIPVKFIGVGEQMDDLQVFHADEFVKAMFEE